MVILIKKERSYSNNNYIDRTNGEFKVDDDLADFSDSIVEILDSIYDSHSMQPEDARKK